MLFEDSGAEAGSVAESKTERAERSETDLKHQALLNSILLNHLWTLPYQLVNRSLKKAPISVSAKEIDLKDQTVRNTISDRVLYARNVENLLKFQLNGLYQEAINDRTFAEYFFKNKDRLAEESREKFGAWNRANYQAHLVAGGPPAIQLPIEEIQRSFEKIEEALMAKFPDIGFRYAKPPAQVATVFQAQHVPTEPAQSSDESDEVDDHQSIRSQRSLSTVEPPLPEVSAQTDTPSFWKTTKGKVAIGALILLAAVGFGLACAFAPPVAAALLLVAKATVGAIPGVSSFLTTVAASTVGKLVAGFLTVTVPVALGGLVRAAVNKVRSMFAQKQNRAASSASHEDFSDEDDDQVASQERSVTSSRSSSRDSAADMAAGAPISRNNSWSQFQAPVGFAQQRVESQPIDIPGAKKHRNADPRVAENQRRLDGAELQRRGGDQDGSAPHF